MKLPIMIVALCAVLAFVGCGSDSSGSSDSTASESPALTAKPKVTVPEGAPPKKLEVKDLQTGSGAEAEPGDKVTVQYVGVGYESGEEFDASWGREPLSFTLGAGEVIPGWDQGIEGMRPGGRRELIIPPNLAYGEAGAPPAIGPNETLVFVIDMFENGAPSNPR